MAYNRQPANAYESEKKIVPLGTISATKFEADTSNPNIGLVLQYYRYGDKEGIKTFLEPINQTKRPKTFDHPGYGQTNQDQQEYEAWKMAQELARKWDKDAMRHRKSTLTKVKNYLMKSGALKKTQGREKRSQSSMQRGRYYRFDDMFGKAKNIAGLFEVKDSTKITGTHVMHDGRKWTTHLGQQFHRARHYVGHDSDFTFPKLEKDARAAILKNKNNPFLAKMISEIEAYGGSMKNFKPELAMALKKTNQMPAGVAGAQSQHLIVQLPANLAMEFKLSVGGRKLINEMLKDDKKAISLSNMDKIQKKATSLGFLNTSMLAIQPNAYTELYQLELAAVIDIEDFYKLVKKIDSIANKTNMEPSLIEMKAYGYSAGGGRYNSDLGLSSIVRMTRSDEEQIGDIESKCGIKIGFGISDIIEDYKAMISTMTQISNYIKKLTGE
jgi:hypothetical protein